MPRGWSIDRAWIRFSSLLVLAFAVPIDAAGQAVTSEAELRERCKLAWESIRTLHFECKEANLGGGEPDYSRGYNRFEFWQAPGGKRALTTHAVHPDGEVLASEFRQDGRRRYNVNFFDGHPEEIRDVAVVNQPDAEDRYEGVMNSVLWLLLPSGKPVHAHLEDGASLADDEGEHRDGRVTIVSEHQGRPLTIVLDPDRDWLPVEVNIQDGLHRVVATDFRRDNGRWFPVSGRSERVRGDEVQATGFEVTEFQMNRPIDPRHFSMPEVGEGVPVVDLTGRASRTEIEGGMDALRGRVERYAGEPSGQERAAAEPIVVPRSRGANVLAYGLAAVGGVALVVAAGAMALRWSRQG